MEERISEILLVYRDTIKPLLADIQYRRGGRLPDNFLNEIRALNDHIARCYRDGIEEEMVNSELTKAEGHLRRLVYDCFKQLNIYICDTLNAKERRFYSDMWLTYEGGNFWREYSKNRKYAQQNVIEAKRNESFDADAAMACYERAFLNYRHAEEMLLSNKKMLYLSWANKCWQKAGSLGSWLIITIVLSVIGAVVGLFV